MATIKVKCSYCDSEEIVVYGKHRTGSQRYLFGYEEFQKMVTAVLKNKQNQIWL